MATLLYVDNNYHPSLDCAQNDAFTVSNTAGNQALTYKIGLLSIDEVTYSGLTYGDSYSNPTNFLSLEVYDAVATMSPAANYGSPAATMDLQAYVYENPMTISAFQNPLGVPGHSVIPVVSLKQSKTYAQGGDGTLTNPYVIQ